jgi:TonB family protein
MRFAIAPATNDLHTDLLATRPLSAPTSQQEPVMELSVFIAFLALAQMNGARPVSSELTPPAVIRKFEPEYSAEARSKRIEGVVKLSAVINAAGAAVKIRVTAPLDPGLDQRAVEAVQQWRFRTAKKDGTPVAVTAAISVDFRLPNPVFQRPAPPKRDPDPMVDNLWWIFM